MCTPCTPTPLPQFIGHVHANHMDILINIKSPLIISIHPLLQGLMEIGSGLGYASGPAVGGYLYLVHAYVHV